MSLIQVSPELFFRGRPGDPRLGEFANTLDTKDLNAKRFNRKTIIIQGAPDDTGVLKNRGRAGASGGPDGIRAAFYKMAWPLDPKFEKQIQWFDAGNIPVEAKNIVATHTHAQNATTQHAQTGATVIALGGGHDFAAPHFLGWAKGIMTSDKKKKTFGLINIDPHLDVRELENNEPHSGTPFRQILDSNMLAGKNFVEFGARDGRNARAHMTYCQKNKVRVRLFEELCTKPNMLGPFKLELARLEKTTTDIGLTIDMDSCRELEGVSAAPVIGFSALELCQMAFTAGASKKVGFLELAEVAPALDPTGRAARIAAEVLFWFMRGRINLR